MKDDEKRDVIADEMVDDKPDVTATSGASLFDLSMERKLSTYYHQGYQDGIHFMVVAFVMALSMLIIMRKFDVKF